MISTSGLQQKLWSDQKSSELSVLYVFIYHMWYRYKLWTRQWILFATHAFRHAIWFLQLYHASTHKIYLHIAFLLRSLLFFTGLCGGNSPVTGEFPAQMSSNAEDGSIWWRHHESEELRNCQFVLHVLVLAPTPDIPLWIGNAILRTNESWSTYVLVHRPDCVVKHIHKALKW